ncbi:hypothetical protein Tco_0150457 [Tanacetum coccineum]
MDVEAHMYVINKLEAIRSHFFNGGDLNIRKMMFVKWENVLASKDKGGMGPCASSNWIDIGRIPYFVKTKGGIDLLGYIKKKVGNGEKTLFWYEPWKGDVSFNNLFPRLFALELDKKISVAGKMAQPSLILLLAKKHPTSADKGPTIEESPTIEETNPFDGLDEILEENDAISSEADDLEELDYDPKDDKGFDDDEHCNNHDLSSFHFSILYIDTACCDDIHSCLRLAFPPWRDEHGLDVIDYDSFGSDLDNEIDPKRRGTTVRIDVQHKPNPESPTRIFKRVYVCLGALKQGFKACGTEIFGLDRCFMSDFGSTMEQITFSGRGKRNLLLNNICEVFNMQLVDGRDQPIITCMEYTYIVSYEFNRQIVLDEDYCNSSESDSKDSPSQAACAKNGSSQVVGSSQQSAAPSQVVGAMNCSSQPSAAPSQVNVA